MKIYSCFPNGKAKVLTMSYDDGKLADERLVAIFNKYGIKGTFNLNYGQMENPERIDRDKIKALYTGHEIATHTMTHPTISRCPMTEAAKEILTGRDWNALPAIPCVDMHIRTVLIMRKSNSSLKVLELRMREQHTLKTEILSCLQIRWNGREPVIINII